jgi:hypothetical protein
LLLAALVVGGTGCGNISFDVDQQIPPTFIMGDPSGMVLSGTTDAQPLTLDIMAETQQRHTGPASSAHLKQLTFMITQPAGGTFYFVQEAHIYLVPKSTTSTLPTVEIARLKPVPNETTIQFEPVPGVDMLPYSNEGANITASATGFYPMEDTTYVGYVKVEVKI